MIKKLLCISFLLCLTKAHESNSNISIQQSITLPFPSQDSLDNSEYSDHSELEAPAPYLKEGFNIEDYRDIDYPFVQPENKDYVCAYWSCREYPCRCMVKQPRCPENYVYHDDHGDCEATDVCLNKFKGCGAGEVFSYETCECECYIECASDEIRLPGVCLCGRGTLPVYNEWAVARYFGEKKNSNGFNK